MARPPKATSSRLTRSKQQSPPRNKPSIIISFRNPHTAASSSRGDNSDNDDDSVCSSSKSSDLVLARASALGKIKDDNGVARAPWRHPDELDYFRPYDWSEDKIISQLRSMVFTVPPPVLGKQSFIEITLYDDGDFEKPRRIKVPRGYRVPLMFVAKFQWASLKLVLTSGQREKEWSDYKFDILHLSRLCQGFFSEALAACKHGIIEIPVMKSKASEQQGEPEAMTRKWRCSTFDRALARYNKNWLISREEFLRDFYIEFEDDEYTKDVLKIDWSRWALRGHKGFKLTQDELKSGIDGRMITRGLKKESDGKWVWVDDYVIKQEEVSAAILPPEEPTTLGADESAPQRNEEQSLPAAPSPPPQNGRLSPPNDVRSSPEPTPPPLPTLPTAQPAEETADSTPSVEKSISKTPDQEVVHEILKQLTPEPSFADVEKSHSPLSSLPSSVSSSISPSSVSERRVDDGWLPTAALDSLSPAHSQLDSTFEATTQQPLQLDYPSTAEASSRPSLSPTPPALPPLSIPSAPQSPRSPQSPQSPQRHTPSLASASEGTQPPKSHSPPSVSSVRAKTRSVEPAPETSPLTPINPELSFSDHEQDLVHEAETENSKASMEVDPRLSPTSIDSTPTPSPTISPETLTESTQQAIPAIPNTASAGPYTAPTEISHCGRASPELFVSSAFWVEALVPDVKPTAAELASHQTPYWLPPRPSSTSMDQPNNITPEMHQSSSTPPQPHAPIFLSPLLPPATKLRSTSPDEIPGLGGLSGRRPVSLPPQFVAPTLTARTVTDGSSWHIPNVEEGSAKETPDDTMELECTRSEPTADFEKRDAEITEPEINYAGNHVTGIMEPKVDEKQSFDISTPESIQDASIDLSPLPSTPRQNVQKFTHTQSSDYDDDSDMDFGTPVTSPVIIVPGSRVAAIDMLPPPVSPRPASAVASKPKDTILRVDTALPRAGAAGPQLVEPLEGHGSTTTPLITIVECQPPRDTAPTPIRVPSSPQRIGDEGPEAAKQKLASVSPMISTSTAEETSKPTPGSDGYAPQLSSASSDRTSSPTIPFLPLIPAPLPMHTPNPTLSVTSSAPPTSSHPAEIPPFTTQPIPTPAWNNFIRTELVTASAPFSAPQTFAGQVLLPNDILAHEVEVQTLQYHQTGSAMPNGASTPTTPLSLIGIRATDSDASMSRLPLQSTPRHSPVPDPRYYPNAQPAQFAPNQPHNAQPAVRITPTHANMVHDGLVDSQSTTRKRQRDQDEDEEDDAEATFKSQKRGESLSIREGGIVVRKVVSMVRDTLTGLNDLLEIAADQELIPSEKTTGGSKGKARAVEMPSRDESPPYTPTLPSPLAYPSFRSRIQVESSEVARLNDELRLMKAEMSWLKEQKAREAPVEHDHMKAMRAEMDALRDQLRSLKEGRALVSSIGEVQGMRDEITSLKDEMRALLSRSRRSSPILSTPSTPNLSLRFNNHTTIQTIHPLAHLLAVEPDTAPATPTTASTVIQSEGETLQLAESQNSELLCGDGSERDLSTSQITPQTPTIYDDITLPVKSKRKARMIFSRS